MKPLLKLKRLVVCVKDVMRITGKGETAARAFLAAIKKELKKTQDQYVTVMELSEYLGIDVETVAEFLHS